jgi:hypothetical protein
MRVRFLFAAANDIDVFHFDFSRIDRCGHDACVGRFNDTGSADRTVSAVGTIPVGTHDRIVQTRHRQSIKSSFRCHR